MAPKFTTNPTFCKTRKIMKTSCEPRNHIFSQPVSDKTCHVYRGPCFIL